MRTPLTIALSLLGLGILATWSWHAPARAVAPTRSASSEAAAPVPRDARVAADLDQWVAARRAGTPIRFEVATSETKPQHAQPAPHIEDLGELPARDLDYLDHLLENELHNLERALDAAPPASTEQALLAEANRVVEGARIRAMRAELEKGRYALANYGDGIDLAHSGKGYGVSLLVQPARLGMQVVDAVFVLRHADHPELREAVDYRRQIQRQNLAVAHDAFNRLSYSERQRLVELSKQHRSEREANSADEQWLRRAFAGETRVGRGYLLSDGSW